MFVLSILINNFNTLTLDYTSHMSPLLQKWQHQNPCFRENKKKYFTLEKLTTNILYCICNYFYNTVHKILYFWVMAILMTYQNMNDSVNLSCDSLMLICFFKLLLGHFDVLYLSLKSKQFRLVTFFNALIYRFLDKMQVNKYSYTTFLQICFFLMFYKNTKWQK